MAFRERDTELLFNLLVIQDYLHSVCHSLRRMVRFIKDHPLDVGQALTKAFAGCPLAVVGNHQTGGRGSHLCLAGGTGHCALVAASGCIPVFAGVALFHLASVIITATQINHAHGLKLIHVLILQTFGVGDYAGRLTTLQGITYNEG
jgi:hypothetical protein